MRAVLDPAIEHAISQGLYRDQSLTLLVDCLELLPFSDDPGGGIARIEEVMAQFEHRPYQFRDVVVALGHAGSEAAVSFLLNIARQQNSLQNLETAWIEALGRLNTSSARQVLLSFIDPALPQVVAKLDFDFHNTELYATFIGAWAREDTALKKRFRELSEMKLAPAEQRLLSAVYRELGDQGMIATGANLLRWGLSPAFRNRGLEAQFVEHEPTGRPNTYNLVPRNAERARAELFEVTLRDPSRRNAAFSILGQVEMWRLEYGRLLGEPRHPMIESGEPWPPLGIFAESK